MPEDVLVIGAPSPVALALCAHVLATDPGARVRAVAAAVAAVAVRPRPPARSPGLRCARPMP